MGVPDYFHAKIAFDKYGKKIGLVTDVRVSWPQTEVTITVIQSQSKKFPPLCFTPNSMIKFDKKRIWFKITKKEAIEYFKKQTKSE